MFKELVKIVDLDKGWNNRPDPKNNPGLLKMENAVLTDRGGVATRPGTELIGSADTTNGMVNSLHTAKLRGGTNVMLRSSDTDLEYYNTLTSSWALLKEGYTDAQVFDFFDHNRGKVSGSIDNNFYTYFCNAIEPYSRWRNEAYDKFNTALSGGESGISVVSTLTDEVFYSGTASSVSTTAITIGSSDWAADIWNSGFVVRITNGTAEGEVRDITDGTATTIDFDTITGLTGTPTFEIRILKFPSSGTIIDGNTGTTEAYTAITKDDELTVGGTVANAHDDGAPLALIPTQYPTAPRGNIMTTLFGQVFVAGSQRFPNTLYRSKIDDATDFTFSASRVAGEGDVLDINEARPKITDLNTYEDRLVVGGESYVEEIVFTQDENDLPNRNPIISASLVGPAGRSSKMRDDLLFANKNKEITSLSRIINQDVRPLTRDIGWNIKRAVNDYDFGESRTWTHKQFTFVACKESSDSVSNDVVLVFDNNRQVWVGRWNLPASVFTEYNNDVYFGSAASREVYKMLTDDTVQKKGTTLIGYKVDCETGWLNFTKDSAHSQKFNVIMVEGYIKLNTDITFKLFFDFESSPRMSWTFDPSEYTDNVLNLTDENVMGVTQTGVTPLGVELLEESDELSDEKRFIAYFAIPETPNNYFKLGWESDGANKFVEITNIMANVQQLDNINEKYVIDVENT